MVQMLLLLSAAVNFCLIYKIRRLHFSVDEIRMQMAERTQMDADTNVGIDVSSSDKKLRQLAADLDRQLKLLRKKQIQYTRGDQELKTAVTNISHDIRTPLTAIYGYLELLREETLSDSAANDLAMIKNRVDALKMLSEELFRYSVIMAFDKDDSNGSEELSLRAVLEESIAEYYGAVRKAGIQPQIVLPQEDVMRMLNRQAVMRIFSNIISNALKYSDGDFCVSLDAEGTVRFSNQASKLDQISTGHLFDRFYTVESGRSSTGLGLSIAKKLAEEMGGKADAEYEDGRLCISVSFPEDV